MMVGDDCRHIGECPARCGQVERDPFLLAGEEHQFVESTTGQERVAADHGTARHEAQHGRPRMFHGDPERSGSHPRAHGVEPLGPSYKHSCRQHGDPRVGVKHISSQSKRPGRPPRVVVSKGDVRRVSPGDADITCQGPSVGRQFDDFHSWMPFPYCGHGAVHRCVVDHNHLHLVARQRTL